MRLATDAPARCRRLCSAQSFEVGEIIREKIDSAPCTLEHFGGSCGLVARYPLEKDNVWTVEMRPGNAKAFSMNLRLYRPADASACLSIFDSNVPTYFAPEERSDFGRFLQEQAMDCAFQVIERDGSIVACGGLSRRGDGSAGFCWGMVQRALHRHGLGRELALARLRQAEADPSIKRITLSTSQHTQGFYAGLGFQVTRIVSNGHGAGIDAVEMERRV